MARRAQSKQKAPLRRVSGDCAGCLVVVTAAEQAQLDLLLTAARRRLPSSAFEFPRRITTRRNGPSDAEITITRALFREIEQDGGFIVTWQADGHRFGLPDSVRKLLIAGGSVVVAAPAGVVSELDDICPDVRLLRLAGQLDAARAPLTPKACLRRIVGPRLAERLEAREMPARTDAVPHAGDMPSAVRALSEALIRIERERGVPGPGLPAPKARMRGRTACFRRMTAPPAAL